MEGYHHDPIRYHSSSNSWVNLHVLTRGWSQVRLVIPEGLELSQLFYMWLSSTLWRYLGDEVTEEERHIFRENVFGISLSATGLSEVRRDFTSMAQSSRTDSEGIDCLNDSPRGLVFDQYL